MESAILSERWQAILNSFDAYITAKGLTKSTCRELKSCIHDFMLFAECNNIELPNQCTSKLLLSYFYYITSRPKYRAIGVIQGSTPNHHVYSLRTYFGWLFSAGAISFNPIVELKFPKYFSKKVEAISNSSIQKLFNACESDLERILLSIYYGCGLRRSEGQNLLISDIDFTQWIIIVRKGKFSKRREVPISSYLHSNFKNYLSTYHNKAFAKDKPVSFLIDEKGFPIDGSKAYNLIKLLAKKANITQEVVNLHVLRHSIATHLLENGMEIDLLRNFLGHNSIDTTHHYLKGMGNHWKWNQRNHLLMHRKSANHD